MVKWRFVGSGLVASVPREVVGHAVNLAHTQNAQELAEEDAIAVVEWAGSTALTPLLPKLKGIVCTKGGIGSHLAILAREFGIPCLMATELGENIEGRIVRISEAGEVEVMEEG